MTTVNPGAASYFSRVLAPYLGWLGKPGRPSLFVLVPAALVAAAMLLPLVYLLVRAFDAGSETWDLLFRVRVLETLWRTALLAVVVTAASIALAVPIGWLTVRTNLPFRRGWAILTVLPLVIPSYVGGFAVVSALGPKGLLQEYIGGPLGIDRFPEVYGFPGAAITLALLSYPYVLLSVRSAIWGLDPALEETSRNLGNSTRSTFFRVVLPQLRPAIAAGALLVALYTLSDFGAVSLLRFETFTYVVYLQYEAGARELAAASSLVLVVVAFGILTIEAFSRGRSKYYRSTVGQVRPQRRIDLGKWRWPAFAFCAFVVLLALGIPLGVLGYWLIRGMTQGQSLGLEWGAAFNSLYVSSLAALAAVVAAVPISVLAVRYWGHITGLLERVTYIGFALPGIVVAVALVFFGANYASPIYQTLGLLIFAYVVLFLPAALGSVRASMLQVNPRLEEAARGLGRRPYQAFAFITLPMLIPGIVAGGALVFLVTMKELPATLILSPIGFQTLATSVWSSAEAAFFAQTAAPALLLILVTSIPLAFLLLRERSLAR